MTKEEKVSLVKKNFIEAFSSVALNKKEAKVKVEEIVKKSGYNRATFYRYFKDIDHLIKEFEDYIIKQTVEIFKPAIYEHNYSTLYESLVVFDNVLSKQYRILHLFNQEVDFTSRIKDIVFESQKGYPPFDSLDEISKNVVVEYIIGVIRAQYLYYRRTGNKLDSKKLYDTTTKYLLDGLRGVLHPEKI